ncbi:MAG TPA: metallophosphoesterase [Woeseiaceae bacterium]|nr:metallophosphoesterase [Woeseiaceae bacterium]
MTDPSPNQAVSTRVLHLTDPHLFATAEGQLRGAVTHDTLTRAIQHYLASDWQADLAFATGDLVQDDSPEAYEHCKALLGMLGIPVGCVPGNHDVRALMQAALAHTQIQYCGTRESGAWLMVGVDSCISGAAGGAIGNEELARCEQAIEASEARHVLVYLHHPPVSLGSVWLDSVGLADGPEFILRLAATGKVRVVIFGHAHQAHDSTVNGIRILGTPSTCRQFKAGSDVFALDNKPPAYRKIDLYDDGTVTTELVWVPGA